MTQIIAMCALSLALAEANGLYCPPPPAEACWSVTSYWPFDDLGNPVPWGGQADASPSLTANGTHITADSEWQIAAVPLPLVGSTLVFPNGHEVYAADTFGHPVYQAGTFWHHRHQSWVIGVDILTPDPYAYLLCDGEVVP